MEAVCKECGIVFDYCYGEPLCDQCSSRIAHITVIDCPASKEALKRAKNNKLDAFLREVEKADSSYAKMQVKETIELARRHKIK